MMFAGKDLSMMFGTSMNIDENGWTLCIYIYIYMHIHIYIYVTYTYNIYLLCLDGCDSQHWPWRFYLPISGVFRWTTPTDHIQGSWKSGRATVSAQRSKVATCHRRDRGTGCRDGCGLWMGCNSHVMRRYDIHIHTYISCIYIYISLASKYERK